MTSDCYDTFVHRLGRKLAQHDGRVPCSSLFLLDRKQYDICVYGSETVQPVLDLPSVNH